MNLVVDTGNTLTKAAVFEGEKLVEAVRKEAFTPEDAEDLLTKYPGIDRAIVSSVRDDENELADRLRARLRQVIRFDPATPVPIKNGYGTPETLGLDRLAAAVGAAALFPGEDVLTVDLGTALTLDLLTGDGTFCGGNISPGAAMRFRALHEMTGKLPLRTLTDTVGEFGTTTAGAIESGVIQGIIHEIEGTVARLREKFSALRVVFTGGDGIFFADRVNFPIFASADLVLHGLNRILITNYELRITNSLK